MKADFSPRGFLRAALIVLAGALVLSPAFHGDWLWDDNSEITQNPLLRDPDTLGKVWFDPVTPDYFPIKTAVQWMQWQLWQDQTLGYHLTSAGLHLLSALLLWRLLWKLGLRAAWLGGLLFAIHPAAVESVAWIAELKNALSLPPLLLSLCAWLDYDERRRWTDYLRSLLLFLVAMLCKSSVVMLPVILLLYAWWKRGRITRADGKATAAFFAVSLGLGLVTLWFQHYRAIGMDLFPVGGFLSRLAGAGLAIPFYFFKCVFPVELLPIYPRWKVDPPSLIQFLPWLLLVAVLGGLWAKRATWGRHVLFGGGCFLVNLAPVLGFITMSYQRVTWVADHFVYLPLTGLIGLAAAGAGAVEVRLAAPLRPYALGAAAMVLGLLALQSHRHAGHFLNQETLWTYTLQRNLGAGLAHNNLGNALLAEGRVAEALKHYEDALLLLPNSPEAHHNLGLALFQAGRVPEAIRQDEEALRLRPGYFEAHCSLGRALLGAGRTPEAIAHFEQALQLKPDDVEAHYDLANALARTSRMAEAAGHYRVVVSIRPDLAAAQNNLGYTLARMGRLPEAIGHLEQALRIQPASAEMHYNLGYTLEQAGRGREAIGHYEKALQLKPAYAEAHYDLGNALLALGRLPEAIGHYQEALRLKPDDGETHNNLGIALFQSGRVPEAVRQFAEALRLKPDAASMHCNLANALARMGRVAEAVEQYKEVLRLKPDFAEARNNLARLQASPPAPPQTGDRREE